MIMIPLSRSLTVPAPEPAATANAMVLGEHDTTGLLPVGFEFERSGMSFDRFDLSTDGFVRFGGHTSRAIETWLGRLGGGRVAYEVRGTAPRRRLVVSFAGQDDGRTTLQLVVYERTGIVGVSANSGQSLGDPTIRQLDMAQPSESRVNSARKIG